MPIYDFRCGSCGAVRELIVAVDQKTSVLPCPNAYGRTCKFDRVLATPAVQVAMKDRAVCPPLRRYDGTE